MNTEARNQRLIKKINFLLHNHSISEKITYSIHEKDNIYQCVISYNIDGKWEELWCSTGVKVNRGNLRNAKSNAEEIVEVFKDTIREHEQNKNQNNTLSFLDIQKMVKLNTTNFDPNIKTKADWDFYEYMNYWLNNIIKNTVEEITFNGYKRQVTGHLKNYFTMPQHSKTVKEITADDLDDFYNYLRKQNLSNSSIDHYNDNISSAFKSLMRKELVRYNPTKLINPITIEVIEVPTYNQDEIKKLFSILEGDVIEIPTLFAGFYGLRRSEIIGLRNSSFDFINHTFVVNHVCIQNDGKDNNEKIYFKDRTKSKKGCRTFPLFPNIEQVVKDKFKQIEENKRIFGNTYNHEYDGYLCVQENGDLIQPNFFSKRFEKIIKRHKLKKVTPHGLRHSIATLLHIYGTDIKDLQDWLGHQNISSTNRYARSDYRKQVNTGSVVQKIFDIDLDKQNQPKRFLRKKKKTYVVA